MSESTTSAASDVSYQLYSSRNAGPLPQTLRMLEGLGYTQVEGYGALYDAAEAVVRALADTGLSMPSGHFDLQRIERDPDDVVRTARLLGIEAVYCPSLPADERPSDVAGWQDFGARLDRAGQPLRQAGLSFGWHNHDFEFQTLSDGTIPLAAMFAGGPDLTWEADIAWIVRAGADPLDWIAQFGARITAVHVKDIAPTGECEDEDGWADVGHGTIDWRAMLSALADAPVRFFVVEHDKPNDDARFARRSIAALRGLR